jgi:hypothetical protein
MNIPVSVYPMAVVKEERQSKIQDTKSKKAVIPEQATGD